MTIRQVFAYANLSRMRALLIRNPGSLMNNRASLSGLNIFTPDACSQRQKGADCFGGKQMATFYKPSVNGFGNFGRAHGLPRFKMNFAFRPAPLKIKVR